MKIRPGPVRSPVLLLTACLILPSACGEKGFSTGKCYDFFADIKHAVITCRGAPLDPVKFLGPMQPWTEDARLFCPALPRTDIVFKGVPLGEEAVLHVAFGLHPNARLPKEVNPDGLLRFQVRFNTRSASRILMTKDLRPAQFVKNRIFEECLPLPETDALEGDFIFHSDASQGMEGIRAVWCGPVLKSRGRMISPDEAKVTYHRTHTAILDQPPSNEAAGKESWFRADFDEEAGVFQHQEDGRILVTVPPARIGFRIEPPLDARLSFGVAVTSAGDDTGHSVRFQVLVNGEQVFEESLVIRKDGLSLRNIVPLPDMKGGACTIELCTSMEAGKPEDNGNPVALWIHPVIEETVHVPRRHAVQGNVEGKSVLVLVIDALRADHMSLYGYERETTPNLDRAARNGIVFDNAWAQSSWTIPSTATLLTGQYAYTHGLYDAYHWYLVPGIDTITSAFLRAGWTTTAFVANHLVSEDNNFAKGFEAFHVSPYCTAAQLNRMFLNWLDGRVDKRFFAYLHYMEPHMPYAAPGAFLRKYRPGASQKKPDPNRSEMIMENLKNRLGSLGAPPDPDADLDDDVKASAGELLDLYDGEIGYFDDQFGRLIADLDGRGILDDILIVITSDHGEEFLDHGQFLHGQGLHRELLHVPLVFLNSGKPSGRRSDMVGLLDLAPTLLELSGLSPTPAMEGKAGFAGIDLFKGRRTGAYLFAETAHGTRFMGDQNLVKQGAFSNEWKGVLTPDDGRLLLFNRLEDENEHEDLSATKPDLSNRMIKLISEWVKRSRAQAPYNISLFNPSAMEKLREMGYIK